MSGAFYAHPTALVESTDVGDGTRIWAFAHVLAGAVVGRECKIGDHVFIESGAVLGDRVTVKNGCLIWHGVKIGDEVFVGPGAVFTNDLSPRVAHPSSRDEWLTTTVADGASIGANSTILGGVRLGSHCMIGAGSVVTRDVPDHALVTGNPARQTGWVCTCGARLDDALVCTRCGSVFTRCGDGLVAVDPAGKTRDE